MAGGIIMTASGPLFLFFALVAHSQDGCPDSGPASDAVVRCNKDEVALSTYALAITGVVLTAAGIPMLVYGAKHVPAKPGARASVLPWVTPNAAGLRLRLDL